MKRSHKILNILIFLNMFLIRLMKPLITIFIVKKWPFWTFLGKFNADFCLLEASKGIICTKVTTKIRHSWYKCPWEIIENVEGDISSLCLVPKQRLLSKKADSNTFWTPLFFHNFFCLFGRTFIFAKVIKSSSCKDFKHVTLFHPSSSQLKAPPQP